MCGHEEPTHSRMQEDPFPDLQISDAEFLNELEGRQKCEQCGRSRKFFCYSCHVPLKGTEDKIPKVKLPIKVDIIKHPQEVAGKSTCVHAALVSPDQVTVYIYPEIPEYDTNKVVLVFPGPDALTLEQYVQKYCQPTACSDATESTYHTDTDSCDQAAVMPSGSETRCYRRTLEKVVFIDSTWHQVAKIKLDRRIACLQKIEIKTQMTMFWRHQHKKPTSYLSTIEAVYYFMREYHQLFVQMPYTGQYDNLLFFFKFFYKKILFEYEKGKVLKAYESRLK